MGWTSVKKKLPLEGYPSCTVGQYLVQVELRDADPNDDPEILLLWFSVREQKFVWSPGSDPYESEEHDWIITYWRKLPKPIKKKRKNENK